MANESSEEEKGEKKEEYSDPPHVLLFDAHELKLWSFYRAIIVEFVATLLFLYVTIATVIGDARMNKVVPCNGVGVLGIAWSFGGMIFVLVYCTAGISGGHINPAVTFAFFTARRLSIPRAVLYIIAQCGGAICGVGLVKCFQGNFYMSGGGGANHVAEGYTIFTGLAVEVMGTFVLVYIIFSSVDPKRRARDTHVPVLVPLPIGFAIFTIHLAIIPITGTGINPARSFATAVIYNQTKTWDDHWIFWVGPLVGAATAAGYHQYVLRRGAFKAFGSFHSNHIGLYSKISCK